MLLLIAILWIAAPRAWALDPDIELGQLVHRSWTLVDLAPTEVTAMTQTADGLLWIASTAGLYWFDGFRFFHYVNEHSDFPSYNFTTLLNASDGSLWVGLKSGAAARIMSAELRVFDERDGLAAGPVHAIVQDPSGVIWLASRAGLFYFDGSRWQRLGSEVGLGDRPVMGAFVARDGTLWLAAPDGIFSLSPDRLRLTRVMSERFSQEMTRHFAQAPDGAIWLGDPARGLLRIAPGKSAEPPQWQLAGKGAGALLFDRDGSLWIGGDRLRRLVSGRGQPIEELSPEGTLSAGSARTVFEDRSGNIWVGADSGIERFRHANVVRAVVPPVRSPNVIVAGRFNRVWAAYADGSLHTFEGPKLERRETAPLFTAAAPDRGGDIWFGGPDVVARLRPAATVDEQTLELIPLPERLRGGVVQTMVRDTAGTLWISIEDKGLFRWSGGQWTAAADAGFAQLLPDEAPLVSTLEDSGGVWFGYTHNRLVRIYGATARMFTARNGLSVGTVTALHSRGGRLWVGGELGLALLDLTASAADEPPATTFRTMWAMNCQTFVALAGIVETAANELWIFRNRALSRVPQLSDALESKDAQNMLDCITYGTADGPAPSPRQTRPMSSLVEADDGRVWMAASEGVAWVDPRRIREDRSRLLPPSIDGILLVTEQIGGDTVGDRLFRRMPGDVNVLPANPGDIRFRFNAVSLTSTSTLNFRYQLEGQDQRWKDTDSNEVLYTNLPPRKYRFMVMAGNKRTGEYSAPATLSFVIPPAFYQAAWFRALCALFAVVVLALVYRWQVRRAGERLRARLEDRMKERERIARELHDTLLQGIQALVLRFQGVASRIPAQEPARDMMERALELADDVIAEGRDRVNDLRDSGSTPVDLPQEIARVGNELLQDSGIRFAVTVDGEPRALHPIVREEGILIAREALANAQRHAQPRAIEVNLAYERSGLRIGIRDDGRGIDPEVLRAGGRDRHWGLMGMRERATRIRGHLEIWSRGGAGTEIALRVPAAVAYRDQKPRWSWLPFRSRRPLDILSR
ncbi:histidine kinase [Steroidobacter agaridevorans]|uniref:Histidine kinase n=1 Tax=Steroidobacter agaridevorans TaxID=2695856 RepID=A0A829YMY3_9GAMM|nr:histidine kinase [Steroidobacter agaridevorans]